MRKMVVQSFWKDFSWTEELMHVILILTSGSWRLRSAAFCRPFVSALAPRRIALCSGYLHLLSFLTIALLYLVGARVKVK